MIEDKTKKAFRSVAVRVRNDLYRDVKRTLADTDGKFQSLIVKLLDEYVHRGVVLPEKSAYSDKSNKIIKIPESPLLTLCHNACAYIIAKGRPEDSTILKEVLMYLKEVVEQDANLASGEGAGAPIPGDGPAQGDHPKSGTGTKGKKRS